MLTDAMRADGWREHGGGPCPVDGSSLPEIMFRDGVVYLPSEGISPLNAAQWARGRYDWWKWQSPHTDDHIIAYRPERTDHD